MTRLALRRPIKMLLADIDGCLVAVEHAPFDLDLVAEVTALNRASRSSTTIPPLTILSGRPQPYVDALMQVFDIRLPAIFENGAGLATRDPYGAVLTPRTEGRLDDLHRLEGMLEGWSDVMLQMGKRASLSVFPRVREDGIGFIEQRLADLLGAHGLDLKIDPSHECVNVLVPGLDKGLGVRWLAEEVGVDPSEIAGIGDSVGDVAWLERCGASCAPANADDRVKRIASHRSEEQDVAAALEFYRLVVRANQEFAGGGEPTPHGPLGSH